jgi:ferrous iron transport protein B
MARTASVSERPQPRKRTTVAVIGKESSGKSQLISSLTGQRAYTSNFRGSTVTCEIFDTENHEFIDTPGILLKADNVTTALALHKLRDTEKVLIVVKAPQLEPDLGDLLALVRGKAVVGVVTFWDKLAGKTEHLNALEQISRETNVPLIPVDARRLTEKEQQIITNALENSGAAPTAIRHITVPWSVEPQKTPLESKRFAAIFGLLLLLVPAVLSVWCANAFAAWLDNSLVETSRILVKALTPLPRPLYDVAIGRYGLLTMGPLLFVWAVPTVVIYALIVGIYKASGLLDRITVALHPAVRPLGITGRDLVRIVMGFGCNVPAVISTRCCSTVTRDATIGGIAFGSACSYQFGATLAVFAAVSRPLLVVPYLAYLTLTTLVYMRLTAGGIKRSKFLILSMDKPTFLEWPRPSAIWNEARISICHFFQRAMPIFLTITVLASVLDWAGVIDHVAQVARPIMAAFRLPNEAAVAIVCSAIRKDAILLFSNDPGFIHLRSGQILTGVYLAGVMLPCLVTALTIARERTVKFALTLMARQAVAAILFGLILAWVTAEFGY